MLRSDLCAYSDAYIVEKRTKDLLAAVANENDKAEKNVALIMFQLDHAIQKLTVDGRDLDIVMPMYNMLEYRLDIVYRKSFRYNTKKQKKHQWNVCSFIQKW